MMQSDPQSGGAHRTAVHTRLPAAELFDRFPWEAEPRRPDPSPLTDARTFFRDFAWEGRAVAHRPPAPHPGAGDADARHGDGARSVA